ncbi:MAG: hypothetical protein B6U89_07200 [Desulfurococcales archaeon ex4484_58]|nr:MAG: hypothetical protein B6U89_07200 [Desulfurococcales archaeon ex4484_58]
MKYLPLIILSLLIIPLMHYTILNSYDENYIYSTIYILPDGRIYPENAPIMTLDNRTYYLVDDVFVLNTRGIIILRDNIVIDGQGYFLASYSDAIVLESVSNVTVKNMGIYTLYNYVSIINSSNIILYNNTIYGTEYELKDYYVSMINIQYSFNVLIENNTCREPEFIYRKPGTLSVLARYSRNITIKNNTFYYPLELFYVEESKIIENKLIDTGFYLVYSNNNNISNNIFESIGLITLYHSHNNVILYNDLGDGAINIDLSRNNTIGYNEVGSGFNINLYTLLYYRNNLFNNTVKGKPVFYIVNESNIVVEDYGQLFIVNSTDIIARNSHIIYIDYPITILNSINITVTDNEIMYGKTAVFIHGSNNTLINNSIKKNIVGVLIKGYYNSIIKNDFWDNIEDLSILGYGYNIISSNNMVSSTHGIVLNNTVSNILANNSLEKLDIGISLHYSSYNEITGNTLLYCDTGLLLENSSYNNIYHNNFIFNDDHVIIYPSNTSYNNWTCGYPCGGNYWVDYEGADHYSGVEQNILGDDGLGDTPYKIDDINIDYYPLIKPYGEVIISTSPDMYEIFIRDSYVYFDQKTNSIVVKYLIEVLLGGSFTLNINLVVNINGVVNKYEYSIYIPYSIYIVEKTHRIPVNRNGTYIVKWDIEVYKEDLMVDTSSYSEKLDIVINKTLTETKTAIPPSNIVFIPRQTIIRYNTSTLINTTVYGEVGVEDFVLLIIGVVIILASITIIAIVLIRK